MQPLNNSQRATPQKFLLICAHIFPNQQPICSMLDKQTMPYRCSADYAAAADAADELHHFRGRFYFPRHLSGHCLYFCGNSLGLQPKTVHYAIERELHDWQNYAVEGHFHARRPWFDYHKNLTKTLADLAGALPSEVVAMNTLTVNLHLMMTSFYRPDSKRFRIIMEGNAFPSDQYAVETQAKWHGFNPDDAIVEIFPRNGEHGLRTEDIVAAVNQAGDSLALVLFSGVHYQTGQFFDISAITKAAHSVGAYAGFDLAHAMGNVELKLHQWNVDFAVWCSYKYLNSGPGGIGGVFVHERHGNNPDLPRFGGWWGTEEQSRFLMQKGFVPAAGAEGWQLSNAQVFQMAALASSLEIFEEAELSQIWEKRDRLTGYLEWLMVDLKLSLPALPMEIVTPENPAERGAQLSLAFSGGRGKELHNRLTDEGALTDWREPNIIRIAPAPLYNSFTDVYEFRVMLERLCREFWDA